MYVCGLNNKGQLGMGDMENRKFASLLSHSSGEWVSPLWSQVWTCVSQLLLSTTYTRGAAVALGDRG